MVATMSNSAQPVVGPAYRRLVLMTAMAPALWGCTFYVLTELIPPGNTFFAALVRSLPAGLIALALVRERIPAGWGVKMTALAAVNIGAFFPLLLLSAERLPGGVAASVGGAQPLVVAGLGWAVNQERPSLARLTWGAVGAVGVCLVVLTGDATLDAVGIAAGFGGVASMATGIVLARRWGPAPGLSPVGYAGWQLALGGAAMAPFVLLFDGLPSSFTAKAAVGFTWMLLVAGLLTYTLWFRGSSKLPPTSSAVLLLLSPLVAAVVGVVALGQTLSPAQLFGFAAVLSALVASQRVAIRDAQRDAHASSSY